MSVLNTTQSAQTTSLEVTSEPFATHLERGMQRVEAVMYQECSSDIRVLRDASHHILEAGGKRVRPRLALLSFAAVGGEDFSTVAPAAAAIELVHTASVVHDDINDHGVIRRGRPSVNAIWGRTFALLTGDFLFTKVYELMAPYKNLNAVMAEAAAALVEGETLQASAVKDNHFTREVYYDIIGRKTAALFRAAGLMGAELGGGTHAQIDALGQFGFSIGLAFQIVDDILDLTGDTEKLGKTAGLDLAQGKGFASIAGNGAAETTNVEVADPMVTIRQKLLKPETIEEGRMLAHQMVNGAIQSLDVLPPSDAREMLVDLANSLVDREF